MKKIFNFIFFALFLSFFSISCEKDIINLVDPSGSSSDNSGDDISETNFTQNVTIVFNDNSGATISGTNDDFVVDKSGNDVTIHYKGSEYVMYTLSGNTTDGFFKLYSGRKQGITLNDVGLTNQNGAAINVQGPDTAVNKGKRTFIVVNGNNTIADGQNYTNTPSTEDEKAAFFGEGQFVFSGNGALTVNAIGKAGITSDDYIHVMAGPTINISSSAGHGLRGKDYVLISDGTLNITVSANMKKGIASDGYVLMEGGNTTINVSGGAAYDSEDKEYKGTAGIKADSYFRINDGNLTITNTGAGGKGISIDTYGYFNGGNVTVNTTGNNFTSGSVSAKAIKCDGDLFFNGGVINVNCSKHEGIEAKGILTINGGEIYSYSAADDAINSGSTFTINGGSVLGYSAGNDGLDANGDCYVKGGIVYAIGARQPEVAIDANTEKNFKLYVQGGTIVAIGGLERGSSLTQSCYSASSWSKNNWYALTVGSSTYAFKTPSNGGTPLVVSGSSTPTLKSGVTVSSGTYILNNMFVANATVTGGSSVSLSSYSANGGGPWGW